MQEFSVTTLGLFKSLLEQTNIPASADDFEEVTAVVIVARRELKAALAEHVEVSGQPNA